MYQYYGSHTVDSMANQKGSLNFYFFCKVYSLSFQNYIIFKRCVLSDPHHVSTIHLVPSPLFINTGLDLVIVTTPETLATTLLHCKHLQTIL